MSIKTFVKNYTPLRFYGSIKSIYRLIGVPHYWIPYAFMKGKAFHPKQMTLELTFRCNLNCVMCPQAIDRQKEDSKLISNVKAKPELSTDECLLLVDEAVTLGVRKFTITGGEPLLRADALDILGYAKTKGLNCTLLSNGVLITGEIAKRIVELEIDQVTFSLDGPEDIHQTIRKSHGAFERLINAIHLIQIEKEKAGSIFPNLSLTCTISALNADRLSETFQLAKELNINIHYGYLFYTTQEMTLKTNEVFQIGASKDEDQDVEGELKEVNVENLKREMQFIKQEAKKDGIRVSFQPDLKEQDVERRFYDDSFSYSSKCFYPWYAVRINPYGDVYPCSMGIRMGNITDNKLGKIWNNDVYMKFRKALIKQKLFPKCAKCCVLNNKLWSYLPALFK